MAKVKYTAFLADMRNSVASTTFSKNRAGAYSKTKSDPFNPQSVYQMAYRTNFAEITGTWATLSDAERNQWDNMVSAWQRTDIFGDLHAPSGFNLFMRVNLQIRRVGFPIHTVPTLPGLCPIINDITFSISLSSLEMIVNTASQGDQSDMYQFVRATPQLSPGIKVFKNRLTDIAQEGAGIPVDYNIFTPYVAKYGVPTVGMRIGVSSVWVSGFTGQVSIPIIGSAIVQA